MLKNCDKSNCCSASDTWFTESHNRPVSPLDSVRTTCNGSSEADDECDRATEDTEAAAVATAMPCAASTKLITCT